MQTHCVFLFYFTEILEGDVSSFAFVGFWRCQTFSEISEANNHFCLKMIYTSSKYAELVLLYRVLGCAFFLFSLRPNAPLGKCSLSECCQATRAYNLITKGWILRSFKKKKTNHKISINFKSSSNKVLISHLC